MLKLLRNKKIKKTIFYILAAIIIPAFVIWGSASVIDKDKTSGYVGEIFGKKISFDAFHHSLYGWKTQLKLQYGEKAEEISTSFFNPNQAAWDRVIMLEETRKRKIKISNAEVVKMITELPFLQRNGNFDPQAYKLFLQYSIGEQPKVFEEYLRENLSMAKIFEDATKNITISDEEIKKEYEKQNIQTRVKYILFANDGYKDKVSATEDEIKASYEKTKEKLKIPPKINAAYISVELKDTATEEEKTAASKMIKDALALVTKKGLEIAAEELKLEIKETGLFGFEDPIPGLGWMPQLSTMLFDLQKDALSKITETSRGVYLFKIKDKKDSYIPDLNEAKENVKNTLLSDKSKELAKQKAKETLDKITGINPIPFEKAAEEAGIQIKETPLFAREGYVAELGMAQTLKDAAFKLKTEETANEVIELEQGFCVIKSIETLSFDEEKFKKEKEEFSKQLLDQKRGKAFNDFFEDLKKRAKLISYLPEK